jgi:hypothetical protein
VIVESTATSRRIVRITKIETTPFIRSKTAHIQEPRTAEK